MFLFLEHSVRVMCKGLKDRKYTRWKSFSKTLMFLRSDNFKNYRKMYYKKKITQNTWSEKSPSLPFVARQETLLLRLLKIDASKICVSRVIWNFTHIESFFIVNTYNSNITFSKARENSYDFNTEGFSKTCWFIQDHF